MKIKQYIYFDDFRTDPAFGAFESFLDRHPHGNYFQSPGFFELIGKVKGYRPLQLLGTDEDGTIRGSLFGVFQSDGGGVKSWFSRRLIVWGGPLAGDDEAASALLSALKQYAGGKAIFIEFRNLFDTGAWQGIFSASGFTFKPHLNFLVRTDEEQAVGRRMSKSRTRQIKSSLKAGAEIDEAASEGDVLAFYAILQELYREKVRKPLPGPDLFLRLWQSPSSKVFVIRHEGKVIGGIACPIYAGRIIYEWYVCGLDGAVEGIHPSVLATWAPIDYAVKNGMDHFDFMGAGAPDKDYGVREFKSRFGGEEVCYGRYEMVLSEPLYQLGKLGLKVYQKLK